MRLLFAHDIEVDIVYAVFVARKRVDNDSDAVRNFLIEFQQDFFAHDFRYHEFFAAIGYDFLFEYLAALRQKIDEKFFQRAHVSAFSRRYGEYVRSLQLFREQREIAGNFFLGHDVRFRIRHNERSIGFFRLRAILPHQRKIFLA